MKVERETERATIGMRVFHERVSDQLVTLFGSDLPGAPAARLGHYFVGNAGEATALGCTMEVRTALAAFARAAVAYTFARASLEPGADVRLDTVARAGMNAWGNATLVGPVGFEPTTNGL